MITRTLQNLLCVVICLVSITQVSSQEFQRMFRTDFDGNLEVLDAFQNSVDDTYLFNTFSVEMDSTISGLHLAKHGPKGSIQWSADYVFEDSTYTLTNIGKMHHIEGERFLLATQVKKDSLYHHLVISTDEGEIEFAKILYTHPDSIDSARPIELIITDDNEGMAYLSDFVDLDSIEETISVVSFDSTGEDFNTSYFTVQDTFSVDSLETELMDVMLSNFNFEEEGPSYISGKILNTEDFTFFVAEYSDDGEQVWARKYTINNGTGGQLYSLEKTADGNIMLAGSYTDNFIEKGLVMQLDTIGNINWQYRIGQDQNPTYINDLVISNSGNVTLGGMFVENFAFFRPFLVSFDQDGNRVFEKQYNRESFLQVGFEPIAGNYEFLRNYGSELQNTATGGYVYALTQQDFFGNALTNTYLIKTDEEGNTFRVEGETSTCDDDVNLVVGGPITMTDSLIVSFVELDEIDAEDVVISREAVSIYTAPVLPIAADIQCPDSINVLIDATVLNGENYTWYDGEMTEVLDTVPTLLVTDTESYIISVTFDAEVCFALCDTFMVSTYPEMMGGIGFDPSNWCTDRTFQFQAIADGGDGIYEYLWEDGNTSNVATYTEINRDYLVTVTDGCGTELDLSINISENDFEQPDSVSIKVTCADDQYVLNLETSGSIPDESTIQWSNGDSGSTMTTVPEEGTVSVTFIDDCLYEVSAEVEVGNLTGLSLDYNGDAYCSDGVIFITAVLTGSEYFDESNITWSTGPADNGNLFINVSEFGVYSATIPDNCGNTYTEEVTVPDLSQVPEVLMTDVSCTTQGLQYSITNPVNEINIPSIEWTDDLGNILGLGQTSIVLMEAQVVTVTLIDDCQNVLTKTFTIEEATLMTQESIDVSVIPNICGNDPFFTLNAGAASGIDPDTYVWSTGETGPQINVSEVGTYSLEAMDNCGFIVEAEVTIVEDDFFTPVGIFFETTCEESGSTLTASAFGDVDWDSGGYIWNNGEVSPTLNLLEGDTGVFSVSVTDICGNVVSDSIVINQGNFFPCECVSWPNFMNLSSEGAGGDRDETFGPVNWCDEFVTDYQMHIYNSYGNLLFETSDFTMTWDGTSINQDAMPTGTYIYYATYKEGEQVIERSGEITLVR